MADDDMPDVAPPTPGAPAQPSGQSPPGSSPATTPVPNRGQEASALATLSVITSALLKLVGQFPPGSDAGQAVLKAASSLSKYVPPGSTSPGVKNNAMENMMREHQQQSPMAAMQAARGGAQPAPAQAQPPAAA